MRTGTALAWAGCLLTFLTACGTSTSSASGSTASSASGASPGEPACAAAATSGAPRLSFDQAQTLVGTDVRACRISAGNPQASTLVIPAMRTRTNDWAKLISFNSAPIPSGYTESTTTRIYLQVRGTWVMGRDLGQGQDA